MSLPHRCTCSICHRDMHGDHWPLGVLDGPGTPAFRLSWLLAELQKRLPGVVQPFSSDPPEDKLLRALDARLADPTGASHE